MNRSKVTAVILSSLIAVTGMGCSQSASAPQIYPNRKSAEAGPSGTQAAVHRCMSMAEEYAKDPNGYQDTAKNAVIGAGVGAGAGALGGVIMKEKVGRATAAGATIGAIAGIASDLHNRGNHSPSYKQFVEHCLERDGYEVAGWTD